MPVCVVILLKRILNNYLKRSIEIATMKHIPHLNFSVLSPFNQTDAKKIKPKTQTAIPKQSKRISKLVCVIPLWQQRKENHR